MAGMVLGIPGLKKKTSNKSMGVRSVVAMTRCGWSTMPGSRSPELPTAQRQMRIQQEGAPHPQANFYTSPAKYQLTGQRKREGPGVANIQPYPYGRLCSRTGTNL